jgi:hypothetical protein
MQTPSVGRIVHYASHGTPVQQDGTQAYKSECRAAIITEVHDGLIVALCVVNPTGQFFREKVECDPGSGPTGAPLYRGGTWHWPEYVATGGVTMGPVTLTQGTTSVAPYTTNVIWNGTDDGPHS